MKKILGILGSTLVLVGGGCTLQTFNSTPFSTTTPTVEQKPGSHWVDYKYLDKHLGSGESIKEVKSFNSPFGMPHFSIYKEQITKYFQLNKATFALFKAGGVHEAREVPPANMERSGVLYALNDDKQWHIFFEVTNREETDRNNPLYLWNEGKKINLLVHDVVGANNGEGTAKVLASNDLGKTWNIERCFYLNLSEFNKLQQKNKTNFLSTLTTYLKTKFQNAYLNEEYILNQKTGNFEYVLANNDEPNKPVDACKNIVLP
jgi:hypothetical protein